MPYPDVPVLMADFAANESIGRLALRFLILTAARSGEVRSAQWSEIAEDQSTWTVSASKMKANKEHIVPLSSLAQEALKKMANTP